MAFGEYAIAQDLLDNLGVDVGTKLVVEVGVRCSVVHALVAVPVFLSGQYSVQVTNG